MKSLPSFIPLYFEEDESDLWQAIQQIDPEMRSTFIKEALRLVIQSLCLGEKFLTHSSSKHLKVVLEKQEDRDLKGSNHTDSKEDESVEMTNFSLEALFAAGDAPDLSENNPTSSQGYQYMMKNIIGIENDEAVLKVIQGLSGQSSEQRSK